MIFCASLNLSTVVRNPRSSKQPKHFCAKCWPMGWSTRVMESSLKLKSREYQKVDFIPRRTNCALSGGKQALPAIGGGACIGAPGNSDSSVNPFSQKGFDEESEQQRNSGSSTNPRSSRNSGSSSEKPEDPEFQGNNSDSSASPFSPNDFINSKDPENAEDSEFSGGLENQFGAAPSNREAEDAEIDRLAAADGWKPDEEERF
jgi:hypothetical protein